MNASKEAFEPSDKATYILADLMDGNDRTDRARRALRVVYAIDFATLQAHAQALADGLEKVKRFVPLYHEDEDYHDKVHAAFNEARAALAAARSAGIVK